MRFFLLFVVAGLAILYVDLASFYISRHFEETTSAVLNVFVLVSGLVAWICATRLLPRDRAELPHHRKRTVL
jgi:hypothetical protein